jgi:hypothetical protein
MKRPRASRFYVAALWFLPPSWPCAVDPSVRPPPSVTTACSGSVGADPPSALAARQGSLDAGPPSTTAAHLGCAGPAPRSTAAPRRGSLHARHLEDAYVRDVGGMGEMGR